MTSTATDQINGFSGSLALKQPVRLATLVDIVLEGLIAIDGIVAAEGDRVLVKAQATPSQNGIYIASTGVWSRAVDFDATGKVVKGTQVWVTDGVSQPGTLWSVTAANPIVLGTTLLTWQISISAPALGAMISGAIAKATPVDADMLGIADSAASNATKKTTFLQAWANYFKGKADALYQPLATILTTLGALANGSGYLQNNGSGTLSWGAISGGQPIPSSSTFAVGTMIFAQQNSGGNLTDGSTTAGSNIKTAWTSGGTLGGGGTQTGTYTNRSGATVTNTQFGTFSRTA